MVMGQVDEPGTWVKSIIASSCTMSSRPCLDFHLKKELEARATEVGRPQRSSEHSRSVSVSAGAAMPRPRRRDDNESMVKGVAIDDNTNGNKSQAVESSDGTCI
jgi:hypothetical protein